MELKAWMKKHGVTQVALAKLMKTYQANVSNLVNGKVQPTVATIEVIKRITKGEVTYEDLRKG